MDEPQPFTPFEIETVRFMKEVEALTDTERAVLERIATKMERRAGLSPIARTALESVTPVRPTAETSPRDPLQKRPTWFFSMEMDDDPTSCLGDDVPHVLRCIRDQIEGDMTLLDDGEVATYQLKRIDMSDVEVEALPEL